MVAPTQSLCGRLRRLRLTTKMVGRGYYKGNRVGNMGWHTKHGGFIVDYGKVRTFVVPKGLSESKLTPFVTQKKRPVPGSLTTAGVDGQRYLDKWKREGGDV